MASFERPGAPSVEQLHRMPGDGVPVASWPAGAGGPAAPGRLATDPAAGRPLDLVRVFGICVAAVGVLFAGYELVERTWLADVDPALLHSLHIARGIAAAALGSLLATVAILAQNAPVPPQRAASAAPRSIRRRLQNVRLTTKIVVPTVALAVLPTLAAGTFTISTMRESLHRGALERIEFDTVSKARALEEYLHELRDDLLFMSQIRSVRDLVDAGPRPTGERPEELRRTVERELLIFSRGKRAYYQLRLLDSAGREMVRVNVADGRPVIVRPERLQDKSGRYYVREGLGRAPGELYISPLDLNVEHGQVEVPHRRVLRYATPVAGTGSHRALLVINIDADHLFALAGPLPSGTERWLVEETGAFLGCVSASPERRARYAVEKRRTLASDYGPADVRAILGRGGTGQTAGMEGNILSFAPVRLAAEARARRWVLLVSQSRASIEAPIRRLSVFLWVVVALVAAVAALTGILVAQYLGRPLAALQAATRQIASGDLSRRVCIETGDEIEALACDFNTMTRALGEAQERLATWTVHLEREMECQTDRLHQLQSGLARVDKMASIGQMAAAVMHEMGNPLASIKTTIQVAQEADDLCPSCSGLAEQLLREVDRLTAFLRSFARLGRLPVPRFETLSLTQVAQGVVGLM
jgi:signal transduction histidine kinase